MVALEDQVVAILRDAGQPLTTAEVAELAGLSRFDPRTWRALAGLERRGVATGHRYSAMRAVMWTRPGAG
jgi:hypothetical protein